MNEADLTLYSLENIGLPPRLRDSVRQFIPPEIFAQIPLDSFQNDRKTKGFGLTGTSGAGKSAAVAWYCKIVMVDDITSLFRRHHITDFNPSIRCKNCNGSGLINTDDSAYKCYCHEFKWTKRNASKEISWVYWPDAHEDLQLSASKDNYQLLDLHHPQKLKECKLLVLDDLGRERLRPGAESYANGLLSSVITHRDDYNKPTIWTSNLDAPTLIGLYGIPLIDRLVRLSPTKGWLKLPSLRNH